MSTTTASDTEVQYILNGDVTIYNTTNETTTTSAHSALRVLIKDVLVLGITYTLNFTFCALMRYDWSIGAVIKHSYWFLLGPLWYLGVDVKDWIVKEVGKLMQSLKNKFNPF